MVWCQSWIWGRGRIVEESTYAHKDGAERLVVVYSRLAGEDINE